MSNNIYCKSNQEKKISVFVSILPYAGFVKAVGGEKINISVMIPPGASPHYYEPKPRQLRALSKAALFFVVGSGIDFELNWMNKIHSMNPDLKIIDSSKHIKLLNNQSDHHSDHEKEDVKEKHNKGSFQGIDPHVWLSPYNVIIIVNNIKEALIEYMPENKDQFEKNAQLYIEKINKVIGEIEVQIKSLESRDFMVFHPSWGYFAHDFNLEQVAIEIDGKEPSARDMYNVINNAKKHGISIIFASPQFSTRSAKVIAREIKGEVVLIDHLAENYLENLQKVTRKLQAVLN